ncbi:DUF3710 domain-containing protein [Actinomadura sp. DC4]|uniref:DUF3710 domain-containing protein n=1 Tax=Actinomadura sp. DC4 TaxID=3055069 RepID=UPI0025B05AC3|nr:DUF3710 domain-containing protein [Actinomadura sp. DC4]MDN3355030.1 DUF3710 domain-containing protein [Actinomadura sp. DC4]
MFRRRRRDDEPENDLEPTDEETVADEEIDSDEPAVVTHGGPWDSEAESVPEMERVDFGAIQVPIGEGIEIQVNVEAVEQDAEGNPVGGRIVAITIVHGESGLQVQPFAAPKKNGIWDEVRKETADEIKQAEGETQEAEGPFGTELHGMVPVAIPEEMRDQVPADIAEQGFGWQPVRFIGVDGPRWFLRGVLSGAALEDSEQAAVMEQVFQQIVVARGDAPMPPRELLELTLPAEAQQAMAAEAEGEEGEDRPPLNPFERGPEITEVR